MTALSRLLDRMVRPKRHRSYEAAGGGRRWPDSYAMPAPATTTLGARGTIMQRARYAYSNNPLARRIVEHHVASLVGAGWQAQSQHPDEAVRRDLSMAFETVVASVLVPMARALARDGEAVVRLRIGNDGLRLDLLDPNQLDPALHRDLGNGARIIAGVEFDAGGDVAAYHIRPYSTDLPLTVANALEAVRVPAGEVFHIFDPLFPGQVRGVSWLAPVLLKLADHDAAQDAMLMHLKVSSLLTGFYSDPNDAGQPFGQPGNDGGIDLSLEPGVMRRMPVGGEVSFTSPGAGFQQPTEFLKSQAREIAAGAGLMFEQLSADLSSTNYSSARFGLIDYRRRIEMLQATLIRAQFLAPLWRRWIDLQSLAGELPSDATALSDYYAVRFIAPGFQWVDPQKEVQAEADAVAAGFKSRREVVAGRGRDLDELDAEIAADTREPAPEISE
ncbi:MAG: phage portal protein [Pseudomonadota bacterium]